MRMTSESYALLITACLLTTLVAVEAHAADVQGVAMPTLVFGEQTESEREARPNRAWQVDFGAQVPAPTPERAVALDLNAATAPAIEPQAPVARPVAYVYSDGYKLRARIHRYASYVTLPMFAVQAVLGFQLDDDNPSDRVRSAHLGVARGMVGLFGVNSVTGVWNLWEGRKNPTGRTRRFLHGALMLASDAGFVATGMLAPDEEGGDSSTHRRVAILSIAAATTGYLIMFFGH